MKILFITNYGSMYGANQALFYMMKYLKSLYGIETYLLASGGGKIAECCREENIDCFCDDFRISYVDGDIKCFFVRKFTRKIMRFMDYIRIYKKMNSLGLKFDLIHSNASVFDIGYFLAKWWKIPHVWHIREFAQIHYNLHNVVSKAGELKQYRKSNAVIAISDAIRQHVANRGEGIKLYRIYDGIEITEKYNKQYCRNNIVRFCIVGALNEKKNQIEVVKAGLELLNRGISGFEIYIVGDYTGSMAEKIDSLCDKYPELSKRVMRVGYCDDVNTLLTGMDVGIMASDREAFGRVTIEYMANYMSVIGTNSGGTPELIKEVGDLYEPHDITHLAELMGKYIQNPRLLYDKCGKNRIQAEKYSVRDNTDSIYTIYKNILCF